jgi:hypothetical protein
MRDRLTIGPVRFPWGGRAARPQCWITWPAPAVFLLLLSGCLMKQDLATAQQAVDEFHQSLKVHEDGAITVDVAPAFYQAVGMQARRAYLARVRSRLGPPVSSSPVNVHTDHMPAGTFLSARYQTHFENGDAQEDFSWRIESGRPYLAAYTAASPLLLGR